MNSDNYDRLDWKLIFLCYVCQSYAVILIASLPILCIVLVYVWPDVDPVAFWFTCSLAAAILLNLSANWFYFKSSRLQMLYSVEPEVVGDGDVTGGGMRVCTRCNAYANRDTRHCLICQKCVWRRDHHCFFLGRCVGFFNLRYFTAFCFHGFVGTSYAMLILAEFLRREYREFWSADFKYYVIPFASVKWMVGQVSTFHLIMVMVANTVFITSLSTLGMFSLHMYLIYTWRTSYEFWCARSEAQKSWRNFRRAFGDRWPMMFLFPVSATLSSSWSPCGADFTQDVQLSSLKLM